MATGTAGSTARQYALNVVHCMRKQVVFGDTTAVAQTVGILPAGAIVIGGGVLVATAFNFGTNNRIDVGTVDDPDDFATNMAIGTVGNIVFDEIATANNQYNTTDKTVTCTPDITGTPGTTGLAFVYVMYIVNNDR